MGARSRFAVPAAEPVAFAVEHARSADRLGGSGAARFGARADHNSSLELAGFRHSSFLQLKRGRSQSSPWPIVAMIDTVVRTVARRARAPAAHCPSRS